MIDLPPENPGTTLEGRVGRILGRILAHQNAPLVYPH